ncbi:probable G-protein coupled receptor 139 [Narcine bancroftii]|uniref:probable G-protein coupled receptor 139 n=1 Tax=Narcine bancroftii TaxID=1343680 RepID=UPI003831F84E
MGYPAIFYIVRIYYPVLAALGIPVNIMGIVIVSRGKCGLSKCITRYLVGMATADLMVVVVVVVLEQINYLYTYTRFLHMTPVCAVTSVLGSATIDCSVWLTVSFTFDRFIAISCQKLRERYCRERTAAVVTVTVVAVSGARCVPFYFMMEPKIIIVGVPWNCELKAEYFTSPAWKAFEIFDSIFTPLLPIGLIFLFNGLTIRHIVRANKVRRELRKGSEKQEDPEIKHRRRSLVLLFCLSANFTLLWIPSRIFHELANGQL